MRSTLAALGYAPTSAAAIVTVLSATAAASAVVLPPAFVSPTPSQKLTAMTGVSVAPAIPISKCTVNVLASSISGGYANCVVIGITLPAASALHSCLSVTALTPFN